MSKQKPIIAFMYDFDKTLARDLICQMAKKDALVQLSKSQLKSVQS